MKYRDIISHTRSQLTVARRYLSPQKDVILSLRNCQYPWIDEYAIRHFQEDADRIIHMIEEVDEVLKGRAPNVKDLENLSYTKAIVDEALRVFPPGWVVSRRSLDKDELGGYEIPDKAVVIIYKSKFHFDFFFLIIIHKKHIQ